MQLDSDGDVSLADIGLLEFEVLPSGCNGVPGWNLRENGQNGKRLGTEFGLIQS